MGKYVARHLLQNDASTVPEAHNVCEAALCLSVSGCANSVSIRWRVVGGPLIPLALSWWLAHPLGGYLHQA